MEEEEIIYFTFVNVITEDFRKVPATSQEKAEVRFKEWCEQMGRDYNEYRINLD